MVKVAVACDHGGFSLKQSVLDELVVQGYQPVDCGVMNEESVDYPRIAELLCQRLKDGECERGILICGTGIGMSIAANRQPHIRAALCSECFSARMSREHNDSNVLCLGARTIGAGLAKEIVKTWLGSEFAGGRHARRVAMLSS